MGRDQIGQGVGVQQRGIARGDDDDAGVVVGQRGQAAQHRVPRAEWAILQRDVDRASEGVGQLGDDRRDALVIVAQYRDHVLRCQFGDRVQRVRQHAATGDGVQHLRGVGPHPGPGPGG